LAYAEQSFFGGSSARSPEKIRVQFRLALLDKAKKLTTGENQTIVDRDELA